MRGWADKRPRGGVGVSLMAAIGKSPMEVLRSESQVSIISGGCGVSLTRAPFVGPCPAYEGLFFCAAGELGFIVSLNPESIATRRVIRRRRAAEVNDSDPGMQFGRVFDRGKRPKGRCRGRDSTRVLREKPVDGDETP